MSQSLLNISMITKESLRILKNELGLARGVNRQYDDQFAVSGAKIGSTINIRKPSRFTVTDGAALNLQNISDQSVALVLDKQKHVGFQFSSKDMTLSIDEFGPRYLQPSIAAIANKIDYDIAGLYKKVWNCVGTPGTTPSTALIALQAGQKLDENAAPSGDRSLVINPAAQAAMVNGLASLFNNSKQLVGQYEKGSMGEALGFKWQMDQNINVHVTGDNYGDTILVNTTSAADGDTTLICDGFESATAGVLKEGDVFTIAAVYAVNPQSKVSTGSLMQFVCTADLTSSTVNGTIAFSPAFQSTGAYQNIDALPLDEAAITVVQKGSDTEGQSSPANLAFHKDAFVLGMADLELPGGVEMASRAQDKDAGLSVRIVRAYDINNDQHPCRVDVIYGVKAVYPELACRIMG